MSSPILKEEGKIITATFLRGCNFLPAGKSCPLWSGSRNTCNPIIRAAWSPTSEPPVTSSGKAPSVSTTRSQSLARGPSSSVSLPPQTTPRSKFKRTYSVEITACVPTLPCNLHDSHADGVSSDNADTLHTERFFLLFRAGYWCYGKLSDKTSRQREFDSFSDKRHFYHSEMDH